MVSLSPRTGLSLMADADFVTPTVVSSNAVILDQITSITQCTSLTRPSAPFDGQLIYETDKQNLRRYDAATTQWFLIGGSGTNSPKGLIGTFSSTSSALTGTGGPRPPQPGVSPFGTPISLLDYSFTVKANTRYRIIEQGFYLENGTFNTNINNIDSDIMELYTIYGLGSNPGLVSSGVSGLHYIRVNYSTQENGSRRPYFKNMPFSTTSFSGTMFCRSLFRSWLASDGRPSDTIGSYAWVYDLGPTSGSY